jgi:ribosomal protein L11 methyltransferase
VGRCFLLVPGEAPLSEDPAEKEDRIPIRLSRGRAFGSGLHETTISCMETLEKLPFLESKSVLDVGTGTGILSLAALFLGALNAVAFDVDGDATRTCNRNAALNRLTNQLRVFNGTLDALNPSIEFDLVLANIHGHIILKEAKRLTGHGYLVLSGLDYTDSRPVKVAMNEYGLEEVSVFFLKEFVTQVWRCPQGRDQAGPLCRV